MKVRCRLGISMTSIISIIVIRIWAAIRTNTTIIRITTTLVTMKTNSKAETNKCSTNMATTLNRN
jgi:hypothetical protein